MDWLEFDTLIHDYNLKIEYVFSTANFHLVLDNPLKKLFLP
jgi:hypothetical protein